MIKSDYKSRILYQQDGKEYYLNQDGKLVFQETDIWKDYRRSELLPAVTIELDRARAAGRYPKKCNIDALITMQNECPEKAVNYVKYKFLGECSYTQVFGTVADDHFRTLEHMRQNMRIEQKIDIIEKQLIETQQALINIAAALQATHMKSRY